MKTYTRKNSSYLKKAFIGSNFNEMCRLCLSENDTILTPIIQNCKISYQEWIQYSVDVLVEEGDGLPPNICKECLKMVEQAYLFKKKCKASDSKLREHFELLDLTDECKLNKTSFNDVPDDSNVFEKQDPGEDKCNESSAVDSGGTQKEAIHHCDSPKEESTTKSASVESNTSIVLPQDHILESKDLTENENEKEKEISSKVEDVESPAEKPRRRIVKEIKRYILKGEIREGEQEEDLSVCEVVPLDVRNYEISSESSETLEYINPNSSDQNGHLVDEDGVMVNESVASYSEKPDVRIQEIYKLWDNEEEVEEGSQPEKEEEKIILLDVSWEDAPLAGEMADDLEEIEIDLDENDSSQTHRVYTNKNQIKIVETIPKKRFTCFACSELFSSHSAVKEHLNKYHKDLSDTPFCNVCGKSFTCTNSLKRHMAVHTGFKPHKCKICERKFSQGSILKRHILTHELQKPFSCNICQKSYTQKMNLLSHLKTHGFRTGAESYSCKLCSKTFVHQSGLSRHLKLHKGVRFLCVYCKKSFGDASALARHVKTIHKEQT